MGNIVDVAEKKTIPLDPPGTGETPHTSEFCIEKDVRLVSSKLWDLQQSYYVNASIREWSFRNIPIGFSSTSYLAKSYSNVIISYIKDVWKKDSNEKIVVVDIGAGHGRLGFFIVQYLLQMKHLWPDPNQCPFLYVMTDCSQYIVDWWKSNSQLQQFIEGGYIDVCCFDVYHSSSLVCQHSNRVITKDSLHFPPFIILNSVLSSLKQEVVSIQQSGFSPAIISILSSQYEYDTTDPIILRRLQLRWSFPQTVDTVWDLNLDKTASKLLNDCSSSFPGANLIIPTTALSLITFILSWCPEKAVFLIGDYGMVHPDEVMSFRDFVTSWTTMRLPVNFALFQKHVSYYHGFMEARVYHSEYSFVLLCYGVSAATVQRTRLAFKQWVNHQSPEQLHTLFTAVAKESDASIDLILYLMRLAQADTDCLWQFRSFLLKPETMITSLSISLHDVKLQLENLAARAYHFQTFHDVMFDIARFYLVLQEYERAAELFMCSLQTSGEHHASWFYRGVCMFEMKRITQARYCFFRALELNGQYEEAKLYLQHIYHNGDPISLPLQSLPDAQSTNPITPRSQTTASRDVRPSIDSANQTMDSSLPSSVTPVSFEEAEEIQLMPDEDFGLSDIEEEYIMVEHYDSDRSYAMDSIPGKDDFEIEVISGDDTSVSDYTENNVQIDSDYCVCSTSFVDFSLVWDDQSLSRVSMRFRSRGWSSDEYGSVISSKRLGSTHTVSVLLSEDDIICFIPWLSSHDPTFSGESQIPLCT